MGSYDGLQYMFRSDAMIGRVVETRLAATSPDGRRRCANDRLRNDLRAGSKPSISSCKNVLQ
jgi:hypothetical protein